jgi:sialic acid synthase SpsE
MLELYREFGFPVGLSDHSLGIEVPIAAVALGACIIEKHFTFNNKLKSADHSISLRPQELKQMINSIKNVEEALGSSKRKICLAETALRKVARKSIMASSDLKKGTIISNEMLSYMRPGSGIPPSEVRKVLGRMLRRDKSKDEMFMWQDFE